MRVAAYNRPDGDTSDDFTTYGPASDADPFPITTTEQVRVS